MVGLNDSTTSQLTKDIKSTVSKSHLTDHYPVLVEGWSSSDIHSIGLSYYTLLGSELGYIAYVDGTIFDRELRRLKDQDTRKSTAPIADSVWVDKTEHTTACAVEFQKAKSNEAVEKKVRNLVRYDEIVGDMDTLVLHCWDQRDRELVDSVWIPFKRGFTDDMGNMVNAPDADILIYQSSFSKCDNGIVLDSVQLIHEY